MEKTRRIYKCTHCGEQFEHPINLTAFEQNPRTKQCPECGIYLVSCIPKRIPQKWISEGYKGWWIFKKEIGYWEDE